MSNQCERASKLITTISVASVLSDLSDWERKQTSMHRMDLVTPSCKGDTGQFFEFFKLFLGSKWQIFSHGTIAVCYYLWYFGVMVAAVFDGIDGVWRGRVLLLHRYPLPRRAIIAVGNVFFLVCIFRWFRVSGKRKEISWKGTRGSLWCVVNILEGRPIKYYDFLPLSFFPHLLIPKYYDT